MYMDGRYTPEINTRYSKPSANFSSYAYSGKIMLVAVIALFLCSLLFAFFHFYSRWFLLRHSLNSRHLRRHRHRRRSSSSVDSPPSSATAQPLHPSVLNSLPTFIYSGKEGCTLECAVCLSEFEYNETGRILPKCNHGFHLDCIDMWFLSHSSCPLCRAPVNELGHDPEELVIDVVGSDPISSGLRPNCRCDGMGYSLSSSSLPQLLNSVVRVEVAPVAPRAGIGSDPLIGSKPIAGPVKSLTRYLSI